MAKDPICGMEVEEKPGALTDSRDGETYYFCSAGCRSQFLEGDTEEPQSEPGGENRPRRTPRA